MSGIVSVRVVGAGRHVRALAEYGAPLPRVRLVEEESCDAMLVLGEAGERIEPVVAGLAAGRVVLCPVPAAVTLDELARIEAAQRQGGGRLLVGGEIVHSEAGRHGLAAIRAPEFGALRALFVAIRQPRHDGGDVLDELGWEALDFVLAATAAPIRRVHAVGASLFGLGRDTITVVMRGTDDAVVTVELSRCLPRTVPAPGLGEVEIEAVGTNQAVRIEPGATSVRISGDAAIASVPWLDPPVLTMLRRVVAVVDGERTDPAAMRRQGDAIGVMQAIRESIGAPRVVEIAG